MGSPILLEAKSIYKEFNGVPVLEDVSLSLKSHSVHALMGENGAGKSTLMKILMGIYMKDSGEITLRGKPITLANPGEALENGISIINQELTPLSYMTVAENIYLGREPLKNGLFIDYRKLNEMARGIFAELGIPIDVTRRVSELSLGEIQIVEIAKSLSWNSDVVIMDEPTSAIGKEEVEKLFHVIRGLKEKGKGIIYISHRMEEIFKISDEITVLRDGRVIGTKPAGDVTHSELVSMMIGRKLEDEYVKTNTPSDEVVLEVRDFCQDDRLSNIDFKLRKGEILGLYGLMGAGRSEFFNALFGIDKRTSGKISIRSKAVDIKRPSDAIRNRIGYITEDRKESGLNLITSVRDNLTMVIIKKLCRLVFLLPKKEVSRSQAMVDKLRIKAQGVNTIVGNLSGGNQQKVVIGKWILDEPEILLMDEPTRGIDVGAKREIYEFMSAYARNGNSIIMISSELPEIMGMSDRIIVLKDGRIVGEYETGNIREDDLFKLASLGGE